MQADFFPFDILPFFCFYIGHLAVLNLALLGHTLYFLYTPIQL